MATPEVTPEQRERSDDPESAVGKRSTSPTNTIWIWQPRCRGLGQRCVYLFMEAIVDAGVHQFSRHVAEQLVSRRSSVPANYARRSSRSSVAEPGDLTRGTTAEALYHLDKGGFRTVLSRAIWAAFVRSEQQRKTVGLCWE